MFASRHPLASKSDIEIGSTLSANVLGVVKTSKPSCPNCRLRPKTQFSALRLPWVDWCAVTAVPPRIKQASTLS